MSLKPYQMKIQGTLTDKQPVEPVPNWEKGKKQIFTIAIKPEEEGWDRMEMTLFIIGDATNDWTKVLLAELEAASIGDILTVNAEIELKDSRKKPKAVQYPSQVKVFKFEKPASLTPRGSNTLHGDIATLGKSWSEPQAAFDSSRQDQMF